jgi:hypothetical protein
MNIFTVKPLDQMTTDERAAFEASRAATRNQILNDQRTNAKRDAKALKAERAWYRKNRPGQPFPWEVA